MEPTGAHTIQESDAATTPTRLDDPVILGGIGVVLAALVVGFVVQRRRAAAVLPPQLPDARSPEGPTTQAPPEAEPGGTAPEPTDGASAGVLSRMREALGRSRSALQTGLERFLGRPRDSEALEALEEVLIRADVGVTTSSRLIEAVSTAAASDADSEALRGVLRGEMLSILTKVHAPLAPVEGSPFVLLVVGVNGSGKTTTIGKLAHRFSKQGKRVMLAAGDTFRAAAAEQLGVWAERTGADLARLDEGADPGAVIYQALERAQAGGHDVVIVDTAGRLQTRKPLMEQLSKVRRVIQKRVPDGPHETLLVLDGTMGQNGMSQARLFHEATPLTGVAVTKLDGTAKGGMVLAIAADLELPVKLVGLGEQAADLRDFEPEAFVDALL